jgi:two-component system response regulator (stage 0 sporulation protein A)
MRQIKLQLIDTNFEIPDHIKEYFYIKKDIKLLFGPSSDEEEKSIILDILIDKDRKRKKMEHDIINMLHNLGIPSHIKGYLYLKEGVLFSCNNPNSKITKNIYPEVAKKYETTISRVEKNMRTAIEKSFINGNVKYIDDIFGYSIDVNKGKPTNFEFLKALADNLNTK